MDAGKIANPLESSTTVIADANYTIVANFALDQRTLTTSSTVGDPPGLHIHATFWSIKA